MSIVDIGGGFPGASPEPGMPSFQTLATTIRTGILAIQAVAETPIRFIAEPGRYFVSASTAIITRVYSRKGGSSGVQALYCDDGVYGSFNNVVYDHAVLTPLRLASIFRDPNDGPEDKLPSAVFGPTCDGLDQLCSLEATTLPRCDIGDWLVFDNQGAYTHTASFVFNGYTHIPNKVHVYL